MSDLAQSPVKQKTSFKRQKMAMPLRFILQKIQQTFQTVPFSGYQPFFMVFITIRYHILPQRLSILKQPAINIQFVKSYLKNTPSWVILIRDGVMMEYFL